jgi:hypothetical protein
MSTNIGEAFARAYAAKAAREAKAAPVKAQKPRAGVRKPVTARKVEKVAPTTITCYDGFSTESSEDWFAHMRNVHPARG